MSDPFAPEAFKHAPKEVTRYFDEKGLQPSWHWQDVWRDEHARAFTVAKTAGYDVLGDIKDALSKAIRNRQDFEDFKKELEPVLKAKGWWGKTEEVDPLTGKPQTVQLGSSRRLKTIYWANVNSAYAAGEWERTWRTRRALPYLKYLISTALHKRLEHLAWVGTVLPVEDPWWDTHYPPSAWLCQCRTEQLSEEEAQAETRFGQEPEDFGSRTFINKRTGEVSRVPNGIDPGWDHNPGKFRMQSASDLIAGRLDGMDEEARRIAAADLAGSSLFRHIAGGGVNYDPVSTDPEQVSRGQIAIPMAEIPQATAKKIGATSRTLRLSVKDAHAIHAEPELYQPVQAALDKGAVSEDGLVTATIAGVEWKLRLRVDVGGAAVYLEELENDQ